jgi:hypothetical protein
MATLIEAFFAKFNQVFDDQCVFANAGQIVDASFVELPRQRNRRDENQQIKQGQTYEAWKINPTRFARKIVMPVGQKKRYFYGYQITFRLVDMRIISFFTIVKSCRLVVLDDG